MAYDAWTEGYLKAKQSKANKFDPNISIRFERVGNWIVSTKVLGGYKTVICIYHKKTLMEHYKTEQIDTIIKCLNEEQWFIPSKIGFPEEKIDDVEIEDDYPWFELNVWDFKDSTKPPQIDKSPEEVVDLFLAAKGHWEE